MAAHLYAHGATGAVGIQGYATGAAAPSTWVTLDVQEWSGTLEYAEHDTSNTSLTGWQGAQKGKGKLTFTINAQLKLASAGTSYDQTASPISASGPNLQADYCSVKLVGGLTAAGTATTVVTAVAQQIFSCATCIVTSMEITNKENDIVSFKITGRSADTVVINQGS